jgi:hypothetical protein
MRALKIIPKHAIETATSVKAVYIFATTRYANDTMAYSRVIIT